MDSYGSKKCTTWLERHFSFVYFFVGPFAAEVVKCSSGAAYKTFQSRPVVRNINRAPVSCLVGQTSVTSRRKGDATT